MIAVEKAVRHAADGERVLFLCYNSELKKFLALHYENPLIDFMILDGYACRLCGVPVSDYGRAERKMKDFAAYGSFPYDHVIVDEGQDFGRDSMENAGLLQLLHDAVMARPDSKSSFYVFYDRLQTVQSNQVPSAHTECGMPPCPAQKLQEHGEHMQDRVESSAETRKARFCAALRGIVHPFQQ